MIAWRSEPARCSCLEVASTPRHDSRRPPLQVKNLQRAARRRRRARLRRSLAGVGLPSGRCRGGSRGRPSRPLLSPARRCTEPFPEVVYVRTRTLPRPGGLHGRLACRVSRAAVAAPARRPRAVPPLPAPSPREDVALQDRGGVPRGLAPGSFGAQQATPPSPRPRLGAISFLHRFGSGLNRHAHLHAAVTDGVFLPGSHDPDGPPAFLPARPLTQGDLATLTERVRRRVIGWFSRQGLLDAHAAAAEAGHDAEDCCGTHATPRADARKTPLRRGNAGGARKAWCGPGGRSTRLTSRSSAR
jgi:hypothetical protein